ncbi:gypsy type transposase [Tanacetum coccineum]
MLIYPVTLKVCSFMLCDLDFEPLSLSLSSMPSCDLVSLTNMLILLHYLESFKSELAELFQSASFVPLLRRTYWGFRLGPNLCFRFIIGSITDIKSALTQRALQIFCETYHIPDEVHPQLPNPNQTIHEMPTGKIGVYTRFFEYANFRLPLSTFLVDVLRYYHIHISQLSVIGAAKVSHFEVLCCVHGFEPTLGLFHCFYVNSKNKGWMSFSKRPGNDAICYIKPLDSLKNWNDRFFWVDSFACPASFPWNTSKGVSKDPFLKSSEFNAEHYAILVAHPAPFHKYPEPFLCLVGISRYYTLEVDTYLELFRDGDEEMDLLSFIRTADPMKVRVGEKQRADGEPRLLETTVGRVVPLLPVAPARTSSELEASVEKLFGEGDGGEQVEQGDSTGGGKGVDIQPVIAAADTIVEDVAPLQPMRRKKRKTVVDASGPSHPPKKLRDDYGDPSGPSVAGKPRSAVHRLLVRAVLNAEVRGEPIPTLPFVTSSVSVTPERENENPADSVTGSNLRAISAPSSTLIIATVVTATVDAAATAKETPVRPSLFGAGSSSAGRIDPTPGGFSDVSSSDFLIGGIHIVVEPNFDLHKVYVPQWSVTNGSRLNDGRVCREMLEEFAPPKFFASIREMEHDQLFTEFNVGAARQVSLSAEVRMRAEYNIKEKRKLRVVVEEKDILLKAKGEEVDSLKAQLLVKEAEAAKAIRLCAQASKFEAVEKSLRDEVESLKKRNITLEKEKSVLDVRVSDLAATLADQGHALEVTCSSLRDQILTYERLKEQFEEFHDVQMRMVGDKLAKLEVDLSEMTLHFEVKFYPHLLTTIVGRRWLLTHGLKLFLSKCLNYFEYLSALGAAISQAIEKGLQDVLAAGIEHGAHGRSLEDLVAYNPSAEEDYNAALQELRSLDFSLLTELKSHKDASVETIMNLLHLESPLVDAPGMSDLQPDVDQLMVPIHRSEDQAVLGSTSLLFALSVSRDRVERIRKNITEHRSALTGVYVPLIEPLSIAALERAAGTSGTILDTTTALSVTFASTSTISPISTDNYEIVHTDGQEGTYADGQTSTSADANPFPSTDDAELNVPE